MGWKSEPMVTRAPYARHTGIIVLAFTLVCAVTPANSKTRCSPQKYIDVAQGILRRLANGDLSPSEMATYGIKDTSGVTGATLGPVYAWYATDLETVLEAANDADFLAKCKHMGYIYPLFIKGRSIGCVEARCDGGAGWSSERSTSQMVRGLLNTYRNIDDSSMAMLTLSHSFRDTRIIFTMGGVPYITAFDETNPTALVTHSIWDTIPVEELSKAMPRLKRYANDMLQNREQRMKGKASGAIMR